MAGDQQNPEADLAEALGVKYDQEAMTLDDEWELGDYDNGETGCPKCGRFRLCLCPNGKHRCEKCNWSPELGAYAPVENL